MKLIVSILALALVLTGCTATSVGTAPVASTTPSYNYDTQLFIQTVHSMYPDVNRYASNEQLISLGTRVCAIAGTAADVTHVIPDIQSMIESYGLPMGGYVAGAAVKAFCPLYLGVLTK